MQCDLGEQLTCDLVTSLGFGKWCELCSCESGFHCAVSYRHDLYVLFIVLVFLVATISALLTKNEVHRPGL